MPLPSSLRLTRLITARSVKLPPTPPNPKRALLVRVEPTRSEPKRIGSTRTTYRPGRMTQALSAALLAVINLGRYSPDMTELGERRSARDAIDDFVRHLADGEFAVITRRIRRHFLTEYLHHAQQAADAIDITVGELMDPARASAWLSDAADGKTRTRNTLRGPDAAAYTNSMRVRIDSYNAFAEFLCLPDRLDSQPPARGYHLTPADTERLLHDLTVRRPVYANAATSLRTAAVAALVADTSRSVPELARLSIRALQLDDQARVDLPDGSSFLLGGATVQILTRWLSARALIIAELEGSDPGHLWIPTKPGRPRGGQDPVKPGLSRAAVRTLHAAHRTLVTQLLGTPLRPGALREAALSRSRSGEES